MKSLPAIFPPPLSPSTELMPSVSDSLAQVRQLFVTDPAISLDEAGRRHGLDLVLVSNTCHTEKWLDIKREHLAQVYRDRAMLFRDAASERRLPMVTRQLDLLERLQTKILEALDDPNGLNTTELRRMGEIITGMTASLSALLGVRDALSEGKQTQQSVNNFFYFPDARPLRISP